MGGVCVVDCCILPVRYLIIHPSDNLADELESQSPQLSSFPLQAVRVNQSFTYHPRDKRLLLHIESTG